MSAAEWTALVMAAIGAVGALLLQAWAMYLAYRRDMESKERDVSMTKKVDQNTAITLSGVAGVADMSRKTDSAVVKMDQTAHIAAQVADEAKKSIEVIHTKLNGGVEDSIEKAIRPLRERFEEHMRVDEQNMRDIHTVLQKLQEKVK